MRRSVDRLARHRETLLVRATARGLALAALVAAGASECDGQVPELSAPSEMTIISKPSAPTPEPSPARPPAPRGRAMLAIPGLTTPNARPNVPVEGPKQGLESSAGEVSLDAPLEMRPLPESLPSIPGSSPSATSRPLVLESSPMNEPGPLGGATPRPNPSSRRPTTPPQPVPTPARRPRLFGFLAGPAASKPATPGRSLASDTPRDNPAADSELKRRIERQAREVVGNRARSVDVKLDGKQAVVVASGVKFFQKRAVRKQLEGIPALSGLRSTIEVVD